MLKRPTCRTRRPRPVEAVSLTVYGTGNGSLVASRPLRSIRTNAFSNLLARSPKRLLSLTCSSSIIKKNNNITARPKLIVRTVRRPLAVPEAADAAITAVTDHPLIVNLKAPILSIFSCSILYSSVSRFLKSSRPTWPPGTVAAAVGCARLSGGPRLMVLSATRLRPRSLPPSKLECLSVGAIFGRRVLSLK